MCRSSAGNDASRTGCNSTGSDSGSSRSASSYSLRDSDSLVDGGGRLSVSRVVPEDNNFSGLSTDEDWLGIIVVIVLVVVAVVVTVLLAAGVLGVVPSQHRVDIVNGLGERRSTNGQC